MAYNDCRRKWSGVEVMFHRAKHKGDSALKIYKYFSSDVLELVFGRDEFCGVKCSLPKDYNDPFELFLGIDLNVSTECMATYREIIDEIPQLPTTCFSKSPIVPPMWAHYSQNHSGFVLEFDVQGLKDCFEEVQLRDVNYKNIPDPMLKGHVEMATGTRKPRHAIWLMQAVMHEGYFSKYTEWSHEQECRLVAPTNYIENIAGNDILFFPISCVTAMIVGQKFPVGKADIASKIAAAYELDLYKLRIGRSYPRPFMQDTAGNSFVFENGEVTLADNVCDGCLEPMLVAAEECAWCSITEAHEQEAARGNMFRMMERYGTLGDYMDSVRNIERRKRK